jgi:hypothetical protein
MLSGFLKKMNEITVDRDRWKRATKAMYISKMLTRRRLILAVLAAAHSSRSYALEPLASAKRNNVILAPGPTRIALDLQNDSAASRTLNPKDHNLVLVLRGLFADVQPGTVYRLYLNLSENSLPSVDDPGFIGTLSFFGVPKAPDKANPKLVSYYVSEALDRLQFVGRFGEKLSLTLLPGRAPVANSHPGIAEIFLTEE